jgi:hypothetical protein
MKFVHSSFRSAFPSTSCSVSQFSSWIRRLVPSLTWREEVEDPEAWINKKQVFESCKSLILVHSASTVNKKDAVNVTVQSSTIPNSGNGIFARHNLSKGSVISLYPGPFYPPLPLWLVSLPDGSLAIDLRPKNDGDDPYNEVYNIHCALGGFMEAKDGISSNLAMAHLVNHPSKGFRPNVVSFNFYWKEVIDLATSSTEKELLSKGASLLNPIPTGCPWYVDPNSNEIVYMTANCAPPVGIVFIAARDIKQNEELFYDYKFKKTNTLPSWYHPVSYEKDSS